jgi:hypothetical protein
MKLGRLNYIGVANRQQSQWIIAAIALGLMGCEQQASSSKAAEPQDVAAILAKGIRNPQLTGVLGKRLAELGGQSDRLAGELKAAGFKDRPNRQGCTTWTFLGEPEMRLGRDDTLRVHYRDCDKAKGDGATVLKVTFGDPNQ